MNVKFREVFYVLDPTMHCLDKLFDAERIHDLEAKKLKATEHKLDLTQLNYDSTRFRKLEKVFVEAAVKTEYPRLG